MSEPSVFVIQKYILFTSLLYISDIVYSINSVWLILYSLIDVIFVFYLFLMFNEY